MAGNIIWARYKPLIVFWSITLALILATLGIQYWEADLANSYTKVRNETVKGTPITVTITYPTRLFLPALNSPEQIMAIQVSASETTSYTLQLKNGDWLGLYDKDGNVISPHWENHGNAVFMSVVRALPEQWERTQNLEMDFQAISISPTIIVSQTISIGEVTTESLGSSRMRVALGIFARNIALPLGLLSAIVGWAISYLDKETDKAENEFREKLGILAGEFNKDPLFAAELSIELRKSVRGRYLSPNSNKELDDIVHRLFLRDVIRKTIKALGVLAEQGDRQKLSSSLDKIVTFGEDFSGEDDFSTPTFDETAKRCVACLGKISRLLKGEIGGADVIEIILQMWDDFDVSSASLVIYLLNRLPRTLDRILLDKVKDAIESTPHRKRLIRYQQLEWMRKAYSLTLSGEYHLNDPGIIQRRPVPASLQEWFAKEADTGLIASDPFSTDLLDSTWIPPSEWEWVRALSHSRCQALCWEDQVILAHRLRSELLEKQKSSAAGVFLAYWDPIADLLAPDVLGAMTHQIAETWVEFLVHNPMGFLDLHPDERRSLAEYLGWHVGSLPALVMRLKQAAALSLDKNKDKEHEFQLLSEILESESNLYSKDYPPSTEQFLDWLQIRPPWLAYTVLMLLYRETPKPDWRRALDIQQDALIKRGVVVKEFEPKKGKVAKDVSILKWDEDGLMTMLNLRIKRSTTDGRDSFTNLFERSVFSDPLEYDQRLVQKAEGSLSRMLELGHRILTHHAQKHLDDPNPELLVDDWEAIDKL
jgi:hypothetical protein